MAMDHSAQVTGVVLAIVFVSGIIITLGVTWLQQRSKIKAIEVLKTYAERGEEPPAAVMDAVTRINWPPGMPAPQPPRRPTRGEHLSHVAASTVLALGGAGVAWWRATAGRGAPEPLLVIAIIVAVFFAGAAAARLVAALTTGDER